MNPFPVIPSNHGMNQSINTSPHNAAHVSQILLLLLIGVLASLGAPPPTLPSPGSFKARCTIANQEYDINETWYKYLRTPNANLCVRCLCKADGASSSINCVNITCDPSTCAETKKDACCDICQGSSEEVKLDQSLNTDTKREDSKLPCLHNGRVYQHGEEFSSNATGLQAQKPNQCIHCMCQTGLVLCRLRNCDSVQCLSSDTKDCCPTCKDEPVNEHESQSNPVLVTIMVSDGQSQSGDCTAAGVTYSHGSSWHPVIGPFGPMDCVYCKCQNGKIECSRLNCPSVETLSCSKPIQVPGHCCPLCTDEGQGATPVVQPNLHQPSISVTMQHKGTHLDKDVRTMADFIEECLPPQTNTLVHRSQASSVSSSYYQYAFQSLTGDHSTRLLTWTIVDGQIGDFSEQHLSKEELKQLMGTFQFKLQGATRTKFMEKFIRKAKRLPDRCGTRCVTKIQRLEQVLHLREIVQTPECLAQDFTLY